MTNKSLEEISKELKEQLDNPNRTPEDIGIDIISFMFGIPSDEVREAINKMKDMPEVKETLNDIKKCQNEET